MQREVEEPISSTPGFEEVRQKVEESITPTTRFKEMRQEAKKPISISMQNRAA